MISKIIHYCEFGETSNKNSQLDNWKQLLTGYIFIRWNEANFKLEDNPYARWNDNIPKETMEQMDEALTYETLLIARHELLNKIDESLIEGQKDSFADLTKVLKDIERKIDQSIV